MKYFQNGLKITKTTNFEIDITRVPEKSGEICFDRKFLNCSNFTPEPSFPGKR